MLQCKISASKLLQRKVWRCEDRVGCPQVIHRRSKMVIAGILTVLTVAGLAMIVTAWKTGLVD